MKELLEFIQDDERLREERKKAKKTKDKFVGLSSEFQGGGPRYSEYPLYIMTFLFRLRRIRFD